MSTQITGQNLDLTPAIKEYIEEKVALLHKHNSDIMQVDVELDKNMHHKKGDVFHVRMNVQVPHALLRAEETMDDLYASIDVCRDDIDRQLRTLKSKAHAKHREERKTRREQKSLE